MQDFGTKADNSPPPGGQLSAAEFNNLATENENAVSRSGQALSGASVTQLAQSLFIHGVKSASFQDSGAANAYVATPVSGTNGVLLPASYANLGGAVITFKASNANGGASTLNIGQTTGTLLGSKPIRTQTDTALPANAITAGQYVQVVYNSSFDTGNGAWELLPWALRGNLINIQTFLASGTYAPTPGTLSVIAEIQAAGGGGGGTSAQNASNCAVGTGGGAGGFSRTRLTTGFSGASVVVGTGGSGGVGGNNGGNGGASSFGAAVTCTGGTGGLGSFGLAPPYLITGGTAGIGSGGNIQNVEGGFGGSGYALSTVSGTGGIGGASNYGAGARPVVGNTNGTTATNPGSGGASSLTLSNGAARNGGAGANGIVYIYEYA